MNVSTTSVTCSGWRATGQTCSFTVRTFSLDCELTSDPVTDNIFLGGKFQLFAWSTIWNALALKCTQNAAIIFYAVPSTPAILSVKPFYKLDGSLFCIVVEFTSMVRDKAG